MLNSLAKFFTQFKAQAGKDRKHLAYFAVLEACESGECPVCKLITTGIEQYFETLLYENVNDRGVRMRFRANFGFCNEHTYQFATYNDGLAIALTHRDLFVEMLGSLPDSKKSLSLLTRQTTRCEVCEVAADLERRNLALIQQYAHDPEFQQHFRASVGLCFPHYQALLDRYPDEPPAWITAFHQERYTQLLAAIDRYLESCNFSLGDQRPVLTREESLCWQKLVRTLYGCRGKSSS